MMVDVLIIGAGVTGAFVARELSRYQLKTIVLESHADVAEGTTKANSAIIHAGYDAKPGTLKAQLNIQGSRQMQKICEALEVPYKKNGSLVLAFGNEDENTLKELYYRGIENGVENLFILNQSEVRSMEPNVSDAVTAALYAKDAGIVCPYELTLGAMENAVDNGVELILGCLVQGVSVSEGHFDVNTDNGLFQTRYIVNAAGVYADNVSRMIGDDSFSLSARKGEYILFDKSQGNRVGTVVFQAPTAKGKGILVTPTVDGNLLIGPTADDTDDKCDLTTSPEGLETVMSRALKAVPGLKRNQVVTSFAGLRAKPSSDDFIIRASGVQPNFIHAAGIESPGLSSAPAIGQYVTGILEQQGLVLNINPSFKPQRKGIRRLLHMPEAEINEMIKKDRRYGNVVCRCERITEGEVVESIHRTIGARTLDGIKRRTRSGMGRCQGGFCSPRIMEILARELDIPMDEVTKMGGNSRLLIERTK